MLKNLFKEFVIQSLRWESKAILKKYKPQIIGITGTVGKTSTKEAVYTALSQFESVRRSPKSFNSELGIPLAILGAKNPGSDAMGWLKVLFEGLILISFPHFYPKWLVLEVGTDRPGDIREITEWLHPDIVIVTKLAEVPVHVEAFASPEELFAEKAHLVRALKPDGTLILNADDKSVVAFKNLTEGRVMFFGSKSGSDLSAKNYKVIYDEKKIPKGVQFEVFVMGQESEPMTVALSGTLGEQQSYHILAALAVVKLLNESLSVAVKSFSRESPTPGRMRVLSGIKDAVIIDDTYNSSPVAVEEALKTLKSVKLPSRSGRRIAMLGDMLELGRYTVDAHREIGIKAAKIVDILATVGVRSRATAETALRYGLKESEVFQFDDSREAGKFMKSEIKKGDVILIKGSQGMRMERAVVELMSNPENKEKLLVRQDAEWKNR